MNERDDKQTTPAADMEAVATRVVRMLQEAGNIAYFAGGCVRDLVMGREPHDYDVATSATPEQVSKLFHRTQLVGAKFGVVLVRMKRQSIEVATFRMDHEYADGRRPTGVTFSTPEDDAERRDFTINGMFYDPIKHEVIDFVGGRVDIAARVIRAIGEADRRFAEDHLRLLRAIRFAARLGFEIEPATWEAMRRHSAEIRRISPERIRMELEGILTNANRADAMMRVRDAGLLGHLWEGAAALSGVMDTALSRLRGLPLDAGFELAMAAMLSGLSTVSAVASMESLRCSNETIGMVRWLVTHQGDLDRPSKMTLADLKLLMAHRAFGDLMALAEARLRSEGLATACIEEMRSRAEKVGADEISPEPFVNGVYLIAMGLTPGPRFKAILERLYYGQLNGEIRSREEGMARARGLISGN